MKSELMYSPQNDPYRADPPPLTWRLRAKFAAIRGDKTLSRQMVIAGILAVSLIAFEMFNFDTTRFALSNFLGGAGFLGVSWAVILAIAFCAIDFAGLVRMFTPESSGEETKAVWYLIGAWLLGATMNAVMTWWAVSLTLLDHDFGNEVLSRAQLLRFVPIFVAVLVWLTRILFIGAVTVTGEKLINMHRSRRAQPAVAVKSSAAKAQQQGRQTQTNTSALPPQQGRAQMKERPASMPSHRPAPKPAPKPAPPVNNSTNSRNDPMMNDYPTQVIEQNPVTPAQPANRPNTTTTRTRVKRRPPTTATSKPPVRGASNIEAQARR